MRIFWLGMHKLLVKTELARLRELGYEVYNPPYLSPVPDQSAELNWNQFQPTTLPREVFQELSQHNFFYNTCPKRIGDLLNKYFDVMIVTIHPFWLSEVARVFEKKIIFRTYGQISKLSEQLGEIQIMENLLQRDDFYFLPHAEETLSGEHHWLKDIAIPVPYCLQEEVFKNQGQHVIGQTNGRIMVGCPNIDNNYYWEHFKYIKSNLNDPRIDIFGLQLRQVYDPQLKGTISREELQSSFVNYSSYLYTYDDARVCYLQPIEMMVVGGPVLYLKGSLLDSYHGSHSPGGSNTLEESVEKAIRISNGDVQLAKDIANSHTHVWQRYTPEHVWPQFDKIMRELLEGDAKIRPQSLKWNNLESRVPRRALLASHLSEKIIFDGTTYWTKDKNLMAFREYMKDQYHDGSHHVIAVCNRSDLHHILGFFKDIRLQVLTLEDLFAKHWIGKKIIQMQGLLRKLSFNRIQKHVFANKGFSPLISLHEGVLFKNNQEVLANKIPSFNPAIWIHTYKTSLYWFLKTTFGFKSSLKNLLRLTPFWVIARNIKNSKSLFLNDLNRAYLTQLRFIAAHKLDNTQTVESIICATPDSNTELAIIKKKAVHIYIAEFLAQFFSEMSKLPKDSFRNASNLKFATHNAKTVATTSQVSKQVLEQSLLNVPSDKVSAYPLRYNEIIRDLTAHCNTDTQQINDKLPPHPFIYCPLIPNAENNLEFILNLFSCAKELTHFNLILNEEAYLYFKDLISTHSKSNKIFSFKVNSPTQIFEVCDKAEIILLPIEASFVVPPEALIAFATQSKCVVSRFDALSDLRSLLPNTVKTVPGFLIPDWRNAISSHLNQNKISNEINIGAQ